MSFFPVELERTVERLTSEIMRLQRVRVIDDHFKMYGDFAGVVWTRLYDASSTSVSYGGMKESLEKEYNEVANQFGLPSSQYHRGDGL